MKVWINNNLDKDMSFLKNSTPSMLNKYFTLVYCNIKNTNFNINLRTNRL